MSFVDKLVAAMTPMESDAERAEARAKAHALAPSGSWLSEILQHHEEIEARFHDVATAQTTADRKMAQKELATLLTAHSIAEEAAIYPALAADSQLGHAEMAYQEQSAAKMELGLLERLDPMSVDYSDKLEHICGAVLHHIYSEESTWFPSLVQGDASRDEAMIMRRYCEEFSRYMDGAETQRTLNEGDLAYKTSLTDFGDAGGLRSRRTDQIVTGQEAVEDRPNTGSVTPEDYPMGQRARGDSF